MSLECRDLTLLSGLVGYMRQQGNLLSGCQDSPLIQCWEYKSVNT